MSILKKPYEISVWEDQWSVAQNKFVEKKLCIIGTDKMMSQGRALEPALTRSTNGTTKFSFKMYKWFIDSVTGVKTENPFMQYLVAERKIKLKYESRWYEFLIKDISEPSTSHLYTFNLEDAFVNELSKNGFAFTFDPALQNNLGTAKELGDRLLADTNWTVDSEAFVQTTEEALVHLMVNTPFQATHLLDQTNLNLGIQEAADKVTIPQDAKILAFYSCCKNKPHRFQFIYVEDGNYETNDKGVITNKDCQYYIDIPAAGSTIAYVVHNMTADGYSFILPSTLNVYAGTKYNGKDDQRVSLYARGNRYTYAQQTQYFPQIEKYLTAYIKNGVKYWSYSNTEYVAPNLITNLVSGLDFKSTSGWTGSFIEKSDSISVSDAKTAVETVYGYWNGAAFVNISDDWANDDFDPEEIDKYKACLRFKPNTDTSVHAALINSGFKDKKQQIKNIAPGDKYVLRIKACNKNHIYSAPLTEFTYSLADCEYNATDGNYTKKTVYCDSFSIAAETDGYYYCIFTINNNANGLTPAQFSAKNIRFFIEIQDGVSRFDEYYIEDLQLFKYYESTNSRGYVPIDEQGTTLETQTVTTHYFVTEGQLETVNSVDDLTPIEEQTIDYTIYQPFYCTGATKQRSVTAAESNYFNILQTIAETFEAWLEIVVNHTADGEITNKKVLFKNYIGDNNYASFRYGVNLKGITRTNDSKAIVTKLIVKDNANEHAQNGFCTIKRAGSNITGENILYDFGYYANMGLLNALELERYLYSDGVVCSDGIRRGYYNALRMINDRLEQNNAQLVEKLKAKITLDAELELAESTKNSSLKSYEELSAEFEEAFGFAPQDLSENTSDLSERSDYQKYIKELSIYLTERNAAINTITTKTPQQTALNSTIAALEADNKTLTTQKANLHKDFYTKYYRFIQEGTWIKEDYTDDEKYYADAQSTLYNSCYPKVTYTIDVLEVSQLPGYEHFTFNIGDMTYAEDEELFGNGRAEVVVTEFVQNLDNPSKNTIKVQTYKNQFQDLFQKLTATSQQVQYSTGLYKKATSLAQGNEALKQEFLLGAIEDVSQIVSGSSATQSVSYDSRGIIVTDLASPMNQLRIVAGAIMLAEQDENGEQRWVTGLTPRGISASLIQAGQLDVGTIQIMAGSEPSFRWDAYGITAYDCSDTNGIPTAFKKDRFVRLDRHGLYGADFRTPKAGLSATDGSDWHPETSTEVMTYATFALTWEGLKVTGNDNVVALIGKQGDNIVKIGIEGQDPYLTFSNDGTLKVGGWQVDQSGLTSMGSASTYNMRARASTPKLLLTTAGQSCIFDESGIRQTIDDVVFKAGDKFMVTEDGALYAVDGTFYGEIETEEGKIGGWNISQSGLQYVNSEGVPMAGLYSQNTVESGINAHVASFQKKYWSNGSDAYYHWVYSTEDIEKGYKRFDLLADVQLTPYKTTQQLTSYNRSFISYTGTSILLNNIASFGNLVAANADLPITIHIENQKTKETYSTTILASDFTAADSSKKDVFMRNFIFKDSSKAINTAVYYNAYTSIAGSGATQYYISFLTKRLEQVDAAALTNTFTVTISSPSSIGNAEINSRGVASFYHLMAATGQIGHFQITQEGGLLTRGDGFNSGTETYPDYYLFSKDGILIRDSTASESDYIRLNKSGYLMHTGHEKDYEYLDGGERLTRLDFHSGLLVGEIIQKDSHPYLHKLVVDYNSISYHSGSVTGWPSVGSFEGNATTIAFDDTGIYIHKGTSTTGIKRLKITPDGIQVQERETLTSWKTIKSW